MKKNVAKLLALLLILNPVTSIVSCKGTTGVVENKDEGILAEILEQITTIDATTLPNVKQLSVENTNNDAISQIVAPLVASLSSLVTITATNGTIALTAGTNQISITLTLGIIELPGTITVTNVMNILQDIYKNQMIITNNWNSTFDFVSSNLTKRSTMTQVVDYMAAAQTFQPVVNAGATIKPVGDANVTVGQKCDSQSSSGIIASIQFVIDNSPKELELDVPMTFINFCNLPS